MADYLSRTEILKEVKRIRKQVKKGAVRGEVVKALRAVEQRGKVTYQDSISTGEVKELEKVVAEHPGITYRELANQMARSVNWVRKLVDRSNNIRTEALADRKGMYGRKPHGLWIRSSRP
jgi:23S rRNA A1618 N6-methylase RlmF